MPTIRILDLGAPCSEDHAIQLALEDLAVVAGVVCVEVDTVGPSCIVAVHDGTDTSAALIGRVSVSPTGGVTRLDP